MQAPDRFAEWLRGFVHNDTRGKLPPGLQLQYHSRSSASSHKFAEFIVDDLLENCELLRGQAARGEVAYAIDRRFVWPNGKKKNVDLSFGIPKNAMEPSSDERIHRLRSGDFARLLIAIEEKAAMTEHGKSQPRIYSELNDSHTIVHQGDRNTIAGGVSVINIAATFISPLRQSPDRPVQVSHHEQPKVTENMLAHLRGLPVREDINGVGLDAYCSIVLSRWPELECTFEVRLCGAVNERGSRSSVAAKTAP